MKRHVLLGFGLMAVVLLTGCTEKVEIENISITALVGIDAPERPGGKFRFYQVNPVFSAESTDKVQTLSAEAYSLREARDQFDALSKGFTLGGKLQVLLVSEELVRQYNVFPMLDAIYRQAENSVTARMTVVDGPVREIMYTDFPDKPRLALYVRRLLDTAHRSEATLHTTLQDFHRQYFDKGITPIMSKLRLTPDGLLVEGSALFHNNGKYAFQVGEYRSGLIQLMRKEAQFPVPMTYRMPAGTFASSFPYANISFDIHSYQANVNLHKDKEQFVFDIHLQFEISVTEHTFSISFPSEAGKLEQIIAQKMADDFTSLISTLQAHQTDPVGFGRYVRAYRYDQWQKIKENWPQAFAESQFNVTTSVDINYFGAIK